MDSELKRRCFKKIDDNEPFSISFKYATPDILVLISSILARLLADSGHIYLLSTVIVIIRELVMNAVKANAKRVFFGMNKVDPSNNFAYADAMERFKEEVICDFDSFRKQISASNYSVQMDFSNKDGVITVYVRNNALILPEELKRVNARLAKAAAMKDLSEAYGDVSDDSEGAGLGIVLTVLFLKNIGVDVKNFKIGTDGKNTVSALRIPNELRPPSVTYKIKEEILKDVDGIPTFPENIVMLQDLCNNPLSSIDVIASEIMRDPALSSDVIKLSNSAAFFSARKIEIVADAVKVIGLKNLNTLLTLSNARKILENRYSNFEDVWNHLSKTAFYARNIAQGLKKKGLADMAFSAGLLHDLGKIVLLSTKAGLVEKVAEISRNRQIVNGAILEEVTIGVNHSEIGELIAQKWNFPTYLVAAIAYHHVPLDAPPEYKDVVFCVYLANMLCGIEDKRYFFDYIDESVLEYFGIIDMKGFDAFHDKLKVLWDSTQKQAEGENP